MRFVATIDDHPPGADHGADTDAEGAASSREQRLHQSSRRGGAVADRTFAIRFPDPRVQADAFSFG